MIKSVDIAAEALSLLVISGVISEEEVLKASETGFDGILSLLREKKVTFESDELTSLLDLQPEK